MFSIFCDASLRHNSVGYCIAIVPDVGDIQWHEGERADLDSSTAGELAALAEAVWLTPVATDCVRVFTDLDFLPWVMGDPRDRQRRTLRAEIAELRRACRLHRRVEFRVVDRTHPLYRECHERARLAAGRCAANNARLPQQQKQKRKQTRGENV